MQQEWRQFKLGVICGGPSQERGISLNSARSVMDHLKSFSIEIIPLYVDCFKNFYKISCAQLYSNTPGDFDFKLKNTATKLDSSSLELVLRDLDLVFPVIHGAFGEDGELQALLEKFQIPFIGHSSSSCKIMFQKHRAAEILRSKGFAAMPQLLLSEGQTNALEAIDNFFNEHSLKRAVIKPSSGGSSIGVHSVESPHEAYAKLQDIFIKGLDCCALLEPFCEGKEFTIVVFENQQGEPVSLIPTEIDLSYDMNQIFDFRKKYLPTNQAAYHTPPRFSDAVVATIRKQAENIFKLFEMHDFVRIDGWLLQDGEIYFTDINPISGLEQNSFVFRQASILGMTHREALEYILQSACRRYQVNFSIKKEEASKQSKLPVFVLFGNHNAERQVSLMSGANVWLKLLQSQQHAPTPFLLDPHGNIWELPYSYILNHTVEEIYSNCLSAKADKNTSKHLIKDIQTCLGIKSASCPQPKQMFLDHFLDLTKKECAFVFIAMHGGDGENGTLQSHLEAHKISFNGSNSQTSALCMDKYLTGKVIQGLNHPDILSIPKKSVTSSYFKHYQAADYDKFWEVCCQELGSCRLIIKPRCDGCSTGIILIQSAQDLARYCHFINLQLTSIPPHSFINQSSPIEMPASFTGEYILEPYIETDRIVVAQDKLHYISKEGWIELTVGVLEENGHYHALNPSITVAQGAILSLEEKFQGGTGINLTPPPEDILSLSATQKIKIMVEMAARSLGIQNYARLDIFFNRFNEKMILIEANTLPGLTPSTVIYHQALVEEPSLTPLALLDKIISSKNRIGCQF